MLSEPPRARRRAARVQVGAFGCRYAGNRFRAPALPAAAPEPQPRKTAAALPRGRLALLAAAAALTVALPLGQVLSDQQDELRRIAARRATLDPLVRAVDVQRGLLVHRDLAARVLGGQAQAEAERRVRQGEVDDRLMGLAVALATGAFDQALRESDQLRDDWHTLALRIGARRIDAEDSFTGHRLLVEQLLVVIDILDAARHTGVADPRAAAALAALHGLPRRAVFQDAGRAAAWVPALDRFDAAAREARQALAGAATRVEAARWRLLAAVATGLLLCAALARGLLRVPPPPPGEPAEPEPDLAREPDKHAVAAGLFDRLREGSEAPQRDTPPR